jgi:hypothetical protein
VKVAARSLVWLGSGVLAAFGLISWATASVVWFPLGVISGLAAQWAFDTWQGRRAGRQVVEE